MSGYMGQPRRSCALRSISFYVICKAKFGERFSLHRYACGQFLRAFDPVRAFWRGE